MSYHPPHLKRIKQQPYCCVPACIQMVLRQEGIPLISQQRLGKALGLVIPPAPRPSAGYGTRLQLPEFEPNRAFKKLKIPLHWSWKLTNEFKTVTQLKTFIAESLPEKNLLLCFDWPSVFQPKNPNRWGHVCVLEKIDLHKNTLHLLDPDPSAPARYVIPLQKLFWSMRVHGQKNMAGIWILEKVA